MKKYLSLILVLITTITFNLFAQEQILFDATAKVDLDGYDYVSNFEIVSESGYFTKDELKILQPNEKGIRFMATDVPEGVSTHYTILTAYPSFLNESGIGVGVIYNAGAIKQIKITATTNRPYDEIILLYSTSPNGVIHEIKMPQDFNAIRSMEEFTLVYDNPLYQEDVSKRDVSAAPVLGADADGIYLRGFRIKTNAPSGYSSYSPYSVFYLKSVSIICDKAFTDEQLEAMKALKEEFGIDENKTIREKTKSDIAERNRVRDNEKALMATEEVENSSAK